MEFQNIQPHTKKDNPFRIHFKEAEIAKKLAYSLLTHIPSLSTNSIVIVCIGTDRSTGDALGPLVGTLLKEKNIQSFHIYGTLEDPVHAVNLNDTMKYIKAKYTHPFIIAIDACLGDSKNIGIIQIGNGPVKPGAGVKKDLPHVGHIHITGVVNIGGFMEYVVLQNTRLSLVMNLANSIADGIYKANHAYNRKQALLQMNIESNME